MALAYQIRFSIVYKSTRRYSSYCNRDETL
jgi:hypothetical protein